MDKRFALSAAGIAGATATAAFAGGDAVVTIHGDYYLGEGSMTMASSGGNSIGFFVSAGSLFFTSSGSIISGSDGGSDSGNDEDDSDSDAPPAPAHPHPDDESTPEGYRAKLARGEDPMDLFDACDFIEAATSSTSASEHQSTPHVS